MNIYLLYIDPGTGSALFSILIGAVATVYFLCRALTVKLKLILSGGKTAGTVFEKNPFVIYCEGKQYCNVFKPVLDEFENRKTGVLYLTSVQNDPVFENSWNFVRAEFIGKGNRAFARLNILKADICLMTTPGLDVYQLKRSKGVRHYSHLLHMTSDAVMYRLFGIDYYDSVLLTGDYQKKDIRTLETLRGLKEKQLVTVGCTYLDVFSKKIKNLPDEINHKFTVLVSPSWGPQSILSLFGEKLLDPVVKTAWRVIVRPHPQSKKSETAVLEKLKEKYKDAKNLEWDYEQDNIFSLSKADIMISDFSGIIFDFIFLFDKPVVYVKHGFDLRMYDADDLGKDSADKLWQFRILKEIGVEINEGDFLNIGEIIKNASCSEELRIARLKAKNTAWQYEGEAGKRVVDFLLSLNKDK